MFRKYTVSAFFFISFLSLSISAQPVLKMPVENFDFGFTPQNAEVSYDFWLHSTGKDTLKISRVKTSCGCTKAPLEKDVLAPGDSTRLEIIFTTGRYKNKVRKTTYVATNSDQVARQVMIMSDILIRPDSTYPVVIKPYKLNISQFSEKIRDELKFTITNVSDRDLKPSLVAYPKDLFEVKLPKEIKAGETTEGILILKEAGLNEEFKKSFTIEWNDDKSSRFTIPVVRNVHLAESSTGGK
ncbi:MAG: DUF1573 domain-containing protein [candidate division Zixibacteria bacterium]|nr:DUF1573 domain-containing protein [candidate division Zixibacteria bacterium]